MSRRSVELGFGRWRELAFPLSFFSHWRYGSSCYDCLQETCLHVGWEMEDELQSLFILGEVSLVLFLLRSGVMYLRGHRSSSSHSMSANVELAYSKGHLDAGALE